MKILLLVSSLLICTTALANPYFSGNPYSPIPPGCITNIQLQWALYGSNAVEVWRGQVLLNSAMKPNSPNPDDLVPVELGVWRIGCTEFHRSAVVVEFQVPEHLNNYEKSRYVLPKFGAEIDANEIPLVPLSEPTAWHGLGSNSERPQPVFGDYTGGWLDIHWASWAYILDGPGLTEPPGIWDYPLMGALPYNLAFTLNIHRRDLEPIRIPIPATVQVLDPSPALPLNGRLSGNWVADGTEDQGLILSFANRVPPSGQSESDTAGADLLLFLSWYTYDANGAMLWLTGAAEFAQGAQEVTVPIEHVTGGQFMGGRKAAREIAGQVTITARSCSDLDMDYELPGIGLGSGTRRLRRIQALEIAGYSCRDYEARFNDLTAIVNP